MTETESQALIKVTRGRPDAGELAALTAVLLARTGAATAGTGDPVRNQHTVARWSRLDREVRFADPRTWRNRR
ncbi:hypothetical protein DB35_13310 [Streptomyces abyssalis]|uniref:Acyl-CoA carboxylase subunit epsilon n=1 Tax=Streptomyces abyssalis TaxID=933944 RepID=A0A1E7JGS8_9ACTN|nr:acyl-CoA carboxylase epsilon subunit [Streptomyces abyssalis]OEU85657.1 hypothetical protein AN215_24675 [Streptomyces abyssalis]OEU92879.1 hypothetical protein DB35_13310 [Streptomyces abyssalis]OEV30505.1 hypothetical protein AN219_10385 [Streptomyces nanshensis]